MGGRWAASDSLEGRLQRGRGLGFLDAVSDPGSASLVVRCVIEDPRWDPQVEERGLYYARLIEKLGVALDPIEEHLLRDPQGPTLPLDTLEALGLHGDERALAILRRYLEEGAAWESALYRLANVVPPAALDDLRAIARRRGDESELTADPVVAAARIAPDAARRREFAGLSTEELLERAAREPRLYVKFASALRDHSRAESRTTLLRTIATGDEGARAAALVALGDLGDDGILDVCEELLRSGEPERLSRAAYRAATSLPTNGALERGRQWASATGDLRTAGLVLVARLGSAPDLSLLQHTLVTASHEEDVYLLCDVADGLARIGDASSIEPLEDAYERAVYSYLRGRCALALEMLSREFASTLAYESLWDCESTTRLAGCRALASSRLQEAAPWLRELHDDPAEDPEVRQAAAGRI